MASATVHQQVGEAGRVGVQDLPGATADEVVGAARREAPAVALGDDERGGGFVGERAAAQAGVGQGLLTGRDDHMVQARVGGDDAGAFEFVLVSVRGEVVEGDGEQPLPRFRAVAEEGAGQARKPGGEQGEGGGGAPSGQVGADAGDRCAAGGAPFGRAHAGDRAGVGRQGLGRVARGQESGAYRFDQCVAYAVDGADRVELGCGDGEEATAS